MPFTSRHRLNDSVDPNYQINDTSQAATKPTLLQRIGDDLLAALLEYAGTTFFLLLAFGGAQAAQSEGLASSSASNIEHDMYISLCFGFSLLSSVWLFYRVTGGLFNPNVSLALLIAGVIGPIRFVSYCIAQLLGGVTAAAIVYALTPGPLASNTYLAPGINRAQGVFIEMFITSALVIAVLMLAAEKHIATPFAPVGIGLTLFVCHLWAVYFTGAGMNTARSFGPAVVTGFPYNSHWVYWLGPFLGSLLGSGFYALLKHIKYWRLNPGQDTMDYRESPRDPVQNARTAVRNSISSSRRSVDGTNGGTNQYTEKPIAPNATAAQADAGSSGRPRAPNDSAV
ncbi:aquaporin-like protein [Daedaleopsis nitida]|nr:aquaporin-like protein [Daedaleopsis nitida]